MEQFEEAVAEILMIITDVAIGDFEGRVPVPENPDSALGALCLGVNTMIESLEEKSHQAEIAKNDLEEKLATIQAQEEAIRELSTPVLEIWDDILVLPLVGVIDTKRSLDIMDSLLGSIVQHQARCVIIDITGVEVVDTRTADYLLKIVQASQLLGARCVLTGINPAVAQTLVEIGADLSSLSTLRNLKEGLKDCLAFLGSPSSRNRA